MLLGACAQAGATSLFFTSTQADGVGRVEIAVDPHTPADIGATDFTFEFWIRPLPGNSRGAVPCDQSGYWWIEGNIVFDRDRLPPATRDFGLAIAGGRIVFGVETGNGSYTICSESNVLNGDAWRHVAVQRRVSDGRLWLHVDGVLEKERQGPPGDVSYPDGAQPANPAEPLLVIGREKFDFQGTAGFTGWIDEVRLSSTLRYGSADFSVPTAPFELDQSTLALYHFDEGQGNVVIDQNGNRSPGVRRYSQAAGPEWSNETPFTPGAPGQVQFSAAGYAAGEATPTLTVTVVRVGGSAGAATVAVAVNGGSAVPDQDFRLVPPTLSWGSGETGPRTLVVSILDDAEVEPSETIQLALANPTGAALGAPSTATVTITDNDLEPSNPGALQLETAAYAVAENAGSATLRVVRVGGSDGTVSVQYRTVAGTATASADYGSVSGTLTWPNGEMAPQSITVPISNDVLMESGETFTVELRDPAGGAALGSVATATVSIVDDDGASAGALQLEQASYTVTESAGSVTLTVTRGGGTAGEVSVSYAASAWTAAVGADFSATSGMLTWQSGDDGARTITVPILDDAVAEGREFFTVTLSGPTGGATLGGTSAATITIDDDDQGSGTPPPSPPSSGGSGGGGSVGLDLLGLLGVLLGYGRRSARSRPQAGACKRHTPPVTT